MQPRLSLTLRILLVALAATPLGAAAVFVMLWSRATPVSDGWTHGFAALEEIGTLWRSAWLVQSGHIVPVETLSAAVIHRLLGGDYRWLSFLTWLAITTIVLWCWSHSRKISQHPGWTIGSLAILGLLLCSPVFENVWIWGVCFPITLPPLALLAGWAVMHHAWPAWLRAVLLSGLSVVAFLSYAAGLAVGVSLLIVALMNRKVLGRGLTAWWTVCAGALLGWFLLTYRIPYTHSDGPAMGLVERSFALARFWCLVLGYPVALGTSWQSQALAGSLGLSLLLLGSWAAWKNWRRAGYLSVWHLLFCFGLGSTAIIAIGRATAAGELATTGRFLFYAAFAWIGAGYLIEEAIRHLNNSHLARTILTKIALPAFLVLSLCSWRHGIAMIQHFHRKMLQSEAGYLYAKFAPPDDDFGLGIIHNVAGFDLAKALQMQERKMLKHCEFLPDSSLQSLRRMKSLLTPSFGGVDLVLYNPDGTLTASGTANFRSENQPFDAVYLTWRTLDGAPSVFAIATPESTVEYYLQTTQRFDHPHRGSWSVQATLSSLPRQPIVVEFWACDVKTRRLWLMRERVELDLSQARPGTLLHQGRAAPPPPTP